MFDKTFGLVPTYQHKNEGSKPRSRDTNFKVDALILTKIRFERHKGLENGLNELVLFGF